MTRFTAIVSCCALFGLIFPICLTEGSTPILDFGTMTIWIHAALMLVLKLGMVAYCGFAALHSTQHVSCPRERSMWLLATIVGNALGSCVYYCTAYQRFRNAGCGALISLNKTEDENRTKQSG
jgi:hypothetical protein